MAQLDFGKSILVHQRVPGTASFVFFSDGNCRLTVVLIETRALLRFVFVPGRTTELPETKLTNRVD